MHSIVPFPRIEIRLMQKSAYGIFFRNGGSIIQLYWINSWKKNSEKWSCYFYKITAELWPYHPPNSTLWIRHVLHLKIINFFWLWRHTKSNTTIVIIATMPSTKHKKQTTLIQAKMYVFALPPPPAPPHTPKNFCPLLEKSSRSPWFRLNVGPI